MSNRAKWQHYLLSSMMLVLCINTLPAQALSVFGFGNDHKTPTAPTQNFKSAVKDLLKCKPNDKACAKRLELLGRFRRQTTDTPEQRMAQMTAKCKPGDAACNKKRTLLQRYIKAHTDQTKNGGIPRCKPNDYRCQERTYTMGQLLYQAKKREREQQAPNATPANTAPSKQPRRPMSAPKPGFYKNPRFPAPAKPAQKAATAAIPQPKPTPPTAKPAHPNVPPSNFFTIY